MDTGPKVVLSEFALKAVDESIILSLIATFRLTFSQDGQHLFDTGPIMQSDDGNPVAECNVVILATDILVVEVIDADNHLKLGSVYLDLESMLQLLGEYLNTHENVILDQESDDFPALQLTLKARMFSPSAAPPTTPPIPTFLVFKICAEETHDADFMRYSFELVQLLLQANNTLILHPEQFHKLRDRCTAIQNAEHRLLMFRTLAGSFEREFCLKVAQKRMYIFSRRLFDDLVVTLYGLDRLTQIDFASRLTSLPDTDAVKTLIMQALAESFLDRYSTTHDEADLNHGISWLEAVRRLRDGPYARDFSVDHFQMYKRMYGAYLIRYKLSKNFSDLDSAVESISKAVGVSLPQWALNERPAALYLLTVGLGERFKRLGAEHDVERAIECLDEALAGVSVGTPEQRHYLSVREKMLTARFLRSRDKNDFTQGLQIREELTVGIQESDRSQGVHAKTDLALLLFYRFLSERDAGDENDERYIADSAQGIVGLQRHKEQGACGAEATIHQAIDLFRETADRSDKAKALLGVALLSRFKHCGNTEADLAEAIVVLSRIPDEFRNELLLAEAFRLRCEYCGQHLEDLRSAILYASRVATSVNLDPNKRFDATQFWVKCAVKLSIEDRNSVLMDAFRNTMTIIPSIAWIGMPMQDRHDVLMTIGGQPLPFGAVRKQATPRELVMSVGQTPTMAAAFAISCAEFQTAIEWLDQGRSIVWGQLHQFRVPLDILEQKDPRLAERLAVLARDLSRSSTTTHFWKRETDKDGRVRKVSLEAEGQKHRKLAIEWNEAISDARKLPGFDKFLLPNDFSYLSQAADDGIVVIITVSGKACDALIMFPGSAEKHISHVRLPITFFDVEQMHADLSSLIANDELGIRTGRPAPFDDGDQNAATFKELLANLWYKIVRPILYEAMEYRPSLVNCDEGQKRAHVRWCPTGHLSFLPLHAAGDYSLSGKGHRVFDFVISSYIPTLNSIIRPPPSTACGDATDSTIKVLAVACPYAKGQVSIPDTLEEVTRVGKHVVPMLDQPMSPVSRYTSLVTKAATAEQVWEEMKEATWVHLACHGTQDATTPTNSALLLSDGTRILLSDIAAIHLPRAEFAFLSACQTATGYDKIPSESVHLAAGMLLAGYRSVIGTMWSIEDRHAPHVADDVYGYLLRDGTSRRPDYKESGLALHLALEKLRERIGEESFSGWVPYIHIGV